MLHFPEPILFHPLKHHLLYIRQFIKDAALSTETDIKAALQTIGSSQLDLYTDSLTPAQIARETLLSLREKGSLSPGTFKEYLAAGQADYQIITLSDKTDWVLRWGIQLNRYVHLHPARYAENTIRVKANSLKTAIAAHIVSHKFCREIDLALINQVRSEWLQLPPVKSLVISVGLTELLQLLTK